MEGKQDTIYPRVKGLPWFRHCGEGIRGISPSLALSPAHRGMIMPPWAFSVCVCTDVARLRARYQKPWAIKQNNYISIHNTGQSYTYSKKPRDFFSVEKNISFWLIILSIIFPKIFLQRMKNEFFMNCIFTFCYCQKGSREISVVVGWTVFLYTVWASACWGDRGT